MEKLNKIMLIDDSEADNFIHQRIINKCNITDEVVVMYRATDALHYLKTQSRPDLIFLDINMPGMDGWEFLEEYEKLTPAQKANFIICMLTTSRSAIDREKAERYGIVEHFLSKPLTKDKLMTIVQAHFPEMPINQ
jgi:CheY-like chemotaxis protein